MLSFKLDSAFTQKYKNKPVNFGFNGVGEVLYLRSYSRVKADGSKESWFETIERVVNGCYSVQKDHILRNKLGWNEVKAQQSAQEMYDRMFNFKLLPPGRGLFAMGTPIVHDKGLIAALYNCAFVSTKDIGVGLEGNKPFAFLMDMSMLGVGVGFDTEGAGKLIIKQPLPGNDIYVIPDSREGWVDSTKLLLDSYYYGYPNVSFDYSIIRPKGAPIRTFGGTAPGPEPLRLLHDNIRSVLDTRIGQPITSRDITDLMNMIGCCVVSGNIRRSAEIAFAPITDTDFIQLKDPSINPDRQAWGWSSNNSVFAQIGDSYDFAATLTGLNGEPGYVWLDNCRAYGRIKDGINNKDTQVAGLNPCGEITLESYELCNLVEVYPTNHTSKEDFERTLKYAYLYSKVVSLLPTHWEETNQVKLRNLRLGISQSGIVQAIEKLGISVFADWCNTGYETIHEYDRIYSKWLAVPKSIKLTTVKPSGSVSLLAGTTPGVHFPESTHYIRRMRLDKDSELVQTLAKSGYKVEPDVKQPTTTVVVEFPVNMNCSRAQKDVSIWEKAMLANFMQTHWADNAVSVTVDFDPTTEAKEIKGILEYLQYTMKSISFLPRLEAGAFEQMPYEAITAKQYEDMAWKINKIKLAGTENDGIDNKFCDGDKCVI